METGTSLGRQDMRHPLAPLALLAVMSTPLLAQSTVLVSDGTGDKIVRFEYPSGDPINHFVGAGITQMNNANGMTIGPDGDLYVASNWSNRVFKFEGRTGRPLGEFVQEGSGGLSEPDWLVFGPDGNLYVTSVNNHQVLRYDGQTGEFIDAFVPDGSGSLSYPRGLAFSPIDGDLYVTSTGNNKVLRYDGQTGSFLGEVIGSRELDLNKPHDLIFDEDGTLYVASYASNQVLIVPPGGEPEVLIAGTGGLDGPNGLAIHPDDGSLLVTSWNDNGKVIRYDKDTGEFLGVFLDPFAGGLGGNPRDVLFLPDPCLADFNQDKIVDTRDMIAFLNAWTAGCP
ncbi:hypothetical protein MNBD_PLANCTO03-1352 [hydrothermal vent metagenome]|uniref:SMP-30/Gluconolactonase/LRE-like region domain-containing protein n=1 Tax=hydrothermal vent metagenome TaxID=652676 RepID=A0A3B1E3I4_9ZZZZ